MPPDWNDLKLFLAVARLGGLRAAAESSGVSAPTLGRRMAALETQVGQSLFVRSATGYALTTAGEDLLARAQDAEAAMRAITAWSDGRVADPLVRISAGRWMSDLFASHIDEIWHVDDRIRFEIVTTFDNVDVLRRRAEIDLRREVPDEPGLARRPVGHVAYALYSGRKKINGVEAGYFIGLSGEAAALPGARWLEAHHADRIGVRCNDVFAAHSLVAAGAGLSVLPCFVGDADPRLVRLEGPINELGHGIWLVTHDDRRHERPTRLILDRVAKLLQRLGPLLGGDRPRSWESDVAT